MLRPSFLSALVVAGALVGCQSSERPPPFQSSTGGGPSDAGGFDVEPSDDAAGVCGEELIPAVTNPPNLYFVLDRSGSMNAPYGEGAVSKYETTRKLLGEVLQRIGHRVRYGAAVFPAPADTTGCTPGAEIFPATLGDPPTYAREGRIGPILGDLLSRLGYADEEGGTPTADTLAALRGTLTNLGSRTHVVLATDGAPNCHEEAGCEASECMLNIEGATVSGVPCKGDVNCCDPEAFGEGASGFCVDGQRLEDEVAALFELGVPTYVIGMPGAEAYDGLLTRLAELGGTARAGESAYFSASDPQALAEALYAIGTGVAIRCDIELEREPDDAELVNLYFDGRLVASGEDEGWRWSGARSLQVLGAACAELQSGEVLEAQIVYGCATVVR